jgi:PhnB protein
MAKSIKPIPEGYHTVTPYLIQRDAKRALEYYKKAFGAEIKMSMPAPDGRVMHAEIKIGDSMIFLCDEFPERSPETKSPQSAGCVTSTIFLYVQDVDTVFKKAVEAGARVIMPVSDMFWGDRFGTVADPFGHHWGIATRKEELTPQEVQKRQAEWEKQMAQKK